MILVVLGRRDGGDRGETSEGIGRRNRLGTGSNETLQAPREDQHGQEDGHPPGEHQGLGGESPA